MNDEAPAPPTNPVPLAPDELQRVLAEQLAGWRLSPAGRALEWSGHFAEGSASNEFLLGALQLAQAQARCPDLERKAGVITLRLTTREVGMVTYQDVRLARAIAARAREVFR